MIKTYWKVISRSTKQYWFRESLIEAMELAMLMREESDCYYDIEPYPVEVKPYE